MFRSSYILLSLILFSCSSGKNFNCSTEMKGQVMSVEDFKKSEQIIVDGEKVIIVKDISKDAEVYSPFVIVCDSSLNVLETQYFCSEYIDSVRSDIIYAMINSSRKNREERYQKCKLTTKSISYYRDESFSGYSRVFNTIIDSMEYDKFAKVVKMSIRYSDDLYSWQGFEHYEQNPSYYEMKFNKKSLIAYPLSELHFSKYEPRKIYSMRYSKGGKREWNEMIIINASQHNELFNTIYKDLSGGSAIN